MRDLEAATGHDVGYERCGTLLVALDRDEVAAVRRELDLHQRLGLTSAWLGASECRRLEPGLSTACAGGLHVPHEGHVDPRRLVAALVEAIRAGGGEVRGGAEVVRGVVDAGRLRGVATAAGDEIRAERVVLAGGSWSASAGLAAEPPPVRPVKGQIVRLRAPDGALPAERLVRSEWVYVVPRRNGEVLVGATVEERGFDTAVTAGGVHELLREAYRALPEIAELELVEVSASLRPATPDGNPLIGEWGDEGLARRRRPLPQRHPARPDHRRRRRRAARRRGAAGRDRAVRSRAGSAPVNVRVNGAERELAPGTTVDAVVRTLATEPARGVAVAIDGEVVPRSAWERTVLADGQELEVLRAVQGG